MTTATVSQNAQATATREFYVSLFLHTQLCNGGVELHNREGLRAFLTKVELPDADDFTLTVPNEDFLISKTPHGKGTGTLSLNQDELQHVRLDYKTVQVRLMTLNHYYELVMDDAAQVEEERRTPSRNLENEFNRVTKLRSEQIAAINKLKEQQADAADHGQAYPVIYFLCQLKGL